MERERRIARVGSSKGVAIWCRVIWKVVETEDFADVCTESVCFLSLVRITVSCQGPCCLGTVWVKDLDGLRWNTGFLLPSVNFVIRVGSAEGHQRHLVHDQYSQGV